MSRRLEGSGLFARQDYRNWFLSGKAGWIFEPGVLDISGGVNCDGGNPSGVQ